MKKILITLLLACGLHVAFAQENEKIQIGQRAPELEFNGPDGQPVKLSEINKGRIVWLDFWASWCGPCRRANPALVAAYKKYSQEKFAHAKKGFTVVSVSLDQKKEPWIQAIKDDGLEWPYHMSDLGGWQSKAAAIYGVQFVPQGFLLDENGKVLAKYMTIEQAEADIEKLIKK